MKNNKLITSLKKTYCKTKFKAMQHSPEILCGIGVVGTVVSAVMACHATTKISEITDVHKDTMADIHKMKNRIEAGAEIKDYSLEDAKKDTAITYVQTGFKFVKLYAPSVILGTLSIGALIGSNHILKKRNAALAAAYATVDQTFKKYRERVVERFGEETDKELRYGYKQETVEETVIDEKTGKEKTVKKKVNTVGIDGYSDYAKFFDASCKAWEKNADYNLMFIKGVQNVANIKLKEQGYLFLNDVYEALGIEKTLAGQTVGWIYDEDNPVGDNYVDFFIYECDRERNRAFVNGYENVILLDFNVDGNIMDRAWMTDLPASGIKHRDEMEVVNF